MHRRTFLVAAAGAGAALLAGCSANAEGSAAPTPIQASLVRSYSSTQEMADDSALIVVATAGTDPQVTKGSPAFTTTPVTVTDTLKGSAPAKQIFVFQTGDQTSCVEGLAPVLTPCTEYLLYLNEHTGDTDHPGLTYVVTGVGAYERKGDAFVLPMYAEAEPGVGCIPRSRWRLRRAEAAQQQNTEADHGPHRTDDQCQPARVDQHNHEDQCARYRHHTVAKNRRGTAALADQEPGDDARVHQDEADHCAHIHNGDHMVKAIGPGCGPDGDGRIAERRHHHTDNRCASARGHASKTCGKRTGAPHIHEQS